MEEECDFTEHLLCMCKALGSVFSTTKNMHPQEKRSFVKKTSIPN